MPLTVTDQLNDADLAAIDDALFAHNHTHIGNLTQTSLLVVLRDANGEFLGGLNGVTYWSWLFVEKLAVAESGRGQGIGSRLLRAAEQEAVRRGCTHAYLDTFSFQARPFYEKHGYTLAGTLDDFPTGHSRFFLQKRLNGHLHITVEHDAAMRTHAERDYPHECCGFLVGEAPPAPNSGGAKLVRITPTANTRDDSPRNRFEIDPGELVKVDRAARAEGLSVLGFYHSHPDAPAVPSNFDREHAWPGYCYVIVSVKSGKAQEMKNWLLRDDRAAFDEDLIVIED